MNTLNKIVITTALLVSTTAFAGQCTLVGELQQDGSYAKAADGRAMEYKRSGDELIIGGRVVLKKTEERDGYAFYANNMIAAKMSEPLEFEGKTVRKYFTTPIKMAIQNQWLRAYACKDGLFD